MSKSGSLSEGEQQLFLMEFLVDRVNIPTVRAMQEDILPSTTCVSFQILNLPPINIYQSDPLKSCACPTAKNTESNEQIFKRGKSCLFALPTIALEKPLATFPIAMTVYKKLPAGVLPDVMHIGSHQIEINDLINLLLKDYVFMGGNPSKKIKSTFRIKTPTGQPIGSVTVFLRVSCFGKKIVTQFHIPNNQKPFLFKGGDNSPIFECKKIPSDKVDDRNPNNICPSTRGNGIPPPTSGKTAKLYQQCDKYPNSYSHSSPPQVTPENEAKLIDAKSPNNLKKCGCPRTH